MCSRQLPAADQSGTPKSTLEGQRVRDRWAASALTDKVPSTVGYEDVQAFQVHCRLGTDSWAATPQAVSCGTMVHGGRVSPCGTHGQVVSAGSPSVCLLCAVA